MRKMLFGILAAGLGVLTFSSTTTARPDDAPANRAVVFEFDVVGDRAEQQQWIGRAAQSSMSASVARAGLANVETMAISARNSDDARKLAAVRNARFVVFGSAQLVNGEVRFVGTLLDLENNSTLAALSATGSQDDLFQLQDILGGQVERKLRPIAAPKNSRNEAVTTTAPGTTPQVAAAAPAVAAAPQTVDPALVLTPFQGSTLERSLGVRGSFYQRFIDTPVYQRNYESQYRNYNNGYNNYWGWPSYRLGFFPGYSPYYGGYGYGGYGYGGYGGYGYGGYGYGGYGSGNVIVVTNGNGNFRNIANRR